MFNKEDNERPRFDAVTGQPIRYDDDQIDLDGEGQTEGASASQEKVQEMNSQEKVQEMNSQEKVQEMNNQEKVQEMSTQEYMQEDNQGIVQDGNPSRVEPGSSFNINAKPSKKEEKKALKKAANAGGNGSKKSTGFRKIVKMAAASLMCGVIAGSSMFGVYYAGISIFPSSTSTKSAEIATVSTAAIASTTSNLLNEDGSTTTAIMNVPAVVQAAMPAVVAINGTVTTTTSSSYYNPFSTGTTESSTSGTGIIVGKSDTELLIVTNAHVVDSVNNLSVSFIDETSVTATVKGTKSDKDIAVVAVKIADLKESTVAAIAIADLGDSADIKVGEQVVAIGNALGEGQSATVGWVSAINRSITIDDTVYTNLIMTDAAINPGNSGGALLNASGQVIGINSAKYADEEVEGMGYAIPISSVKDIIDTLSTKVTRAKVSDANASYIGVVKGIDVTSAMASSYNVPVGAMIGQVVADSAAEKAGLVKGDIIVTFDGEDISSFTGLQNMMQYYAAGEKVTIAYYHFNSDNKSYEYHEVDVTLGSAASK